MPTAQELSTSTEKLDSMHDDVGVIVIPAGNDETGSEVCSDPEELRVAARTPKTNSKPVELLSTTPSPGSSTEDLDAKITANAQEDGEHHTVYARREYRIVLLLAILAVYYTLYSARAVLLPVTLACLLSLTLRPVIRYLRKYCLPDSVSAAVVLGFLVVMVIAGMMRLVAPAEEWIRESPGKLAVAKKKLDPFLERFSGIAKTSKTVGDLAVSSDHLTAEPLAVEIKPSELSTNITVASITGNFLGMAVLIVSLAFFLLAAGDRLLNNALRVLPRYSEKRTLVELVYDVEKGVANYLLTVTCINACVGLSAAAIFWVVGAPSPALWGILAFVLNFVPFFGPITAIVTFVMVCIVSFDSLAYALIAPTLFAAIVFVEGNFITPSVMGRSMSLNPIVIFLALIFWGWVWGLGGAVLAVPLVATAKIACDKFERTRSIAVVLGD